LTKFAENLLNPDQLLICTNHFASRVSLPPDKQKQQLPFIEALEALHDFFIYYGHYQDNRVECRRCGNVFSKPNEKVTDANTATELLSGAFQGRFDAALLISAVSDLAAPITKVKEFPWPLGCLIMTEIVISATIAHGVIRLESCQGRSTFGGRLP